MEEQLIEAVGYFPATLILLGILVLIFVLLAIVCDEALAPTLEELSDNWKIPHDVACATFLAAASSAPEIAISLTSVFHGKKSSVDLSLGTLMGSALIAYTIIPAACVFVSPDQALRLDFVPLARDIFFFCAGLLLVIRFSQDGEIGTYESLSLVCLFFAYLLAMKVLAPFYNHEDDEHHFLSENAPKTVVIGNPQNNYGAVDAENQPGKVEEEEEEEIPHTFFGYYIRFFVPPFHLDETDIRKRFPWILTISIVYISFLSESCLFFAQALANTAGLSHHFIGLVLVALGAQVPDTFASMAVARQGEGPSSFANAIGSQVLNINLGIGFPFLASNLIRGTPVTVHASSSGSLVFFTVSIFLLSVLFTKLVLRKQTAYLLIATYFTVVGLVGVTGGENAL